MVKESCFLPLKTRKALDLQGLFVLGCKIVAPICVCTTILNLEFFMSFLRNQVLFCFLRFNNSVIAPKLKNTNPIHGITSKAQSVSLEPTF